jgi:hypothetical protein
MIKKILAILLVAATLLSIIVVPAYATQVDGPTVEEGDMYIENEDGSVSEYTPPETVSPDEAGDAEYVEQGELLSKEEWYAQQGITPGGSVTNNNNTNNSGVSYDDIIIDEDGTGTVTVKFELPEDFYQNILVELYNRKSGEIVQIPVYSANKWEARQEVPSGYYLVYNVLAGGDDALDPDWVFQLGTKITVIKGETISVNIPLLKGPNYVNENVPDATDPSGGMTDIEMKPNDTIPDDQIPNNETLGQKAIRILKGFVTGPNLFILIVLAGSCIVVWYLKKKREDN